MGILLPISIVKIRGNIFLWNHTLEKKIEEVLVEKEKNSVSYEAENPYSTKQQMKKVILKNVRSWNPSLSFCHIIQSFTFCP